MNKEPFFIMNNEPFFLLWTLNLFSIMNNEPYFRLWIANLMSNEPFLSFIFMNNEPYEQWTLFLPFIMLWITNLMNNEPYEKWTLWISGCPHYSKQSGEIFIEIRRVVHKISAKEVTTFLTQSELEESGSYITTQLPDITASHW